MSLFRSYGQRVRICGDQSESSPFPGSLKVSGLAARDRWSAGGAPRPGQSPDTDEHCPCQDLIWAVLQCTLRASLLEKFSKQILGFMDKKQFEPGTMTLRFDLGQLGWKGGVPVGCVLAEPQAWLGGTASAPLAWAHSSLA
ncbi:Hypothetical predicted protein, partial [Marmota monax]